MEGEEEPEIFLCKMKRGVLDLDEDYMSKLALLSSESERVSAIGLQEGENRV